MTATWTDGVTPKVSIVFTAYNAERFIKASVSAALSQTYPNYEVIVLDDGSSDGTERVCRTIRDPRFRYFRRARIGRSRALNEAISLADGEFIAINDADDLSLPHRLTVAMAFFKAHPDAAFIGTAFAETDLFQESIPERLRSPDRCKGAGSPFWPSRLTLYRRNVFNNSTLVYPKAIWKENGGYDERLPLCEDYDFYLRAMQFGPAALLPVQTALWYTNPEGFFKKKSVTEYLKAMDLIKKRAFRLLNLPIWARLYHPLWVKIYQSVQLCRSWQRALGRMKLKGGG